MSRRGAEPTDRPDGPSLSAQLTRQLRARFAVTEVSRLLAADLDLDTLLELVLDLTCALAESPRAVAWLENGDDIQVAAARAITPQEAEQHALESARRATAGAAAAPGAGDCDVPLWVGGRVVGSLCYLSEHAFDGDTHALLETIGRLTGAAVERQHLLAQLAQMQRDAIDALAAALEAYDRATYEHSRRIAGCARALCRAIHASPQDAADIEAAALLHDIGKIRLPEGVVNRAGTLTPEEYRAIKEHPCVGAQIVGRVQVLSDLAPLIRHHHEWIDGRGYPDGLAGAAIPLGARIIGLAEAYDYLVEGFPPGGHLSPQRALDRLVASAGTQFDADLVRTLVRVVAHGEVAAAGDGGQPPPQAPTDTGVAHAREADVDGDVDGDVERITTDALESLTPREREVLRLIARGYSNTQIARELVISPKTAKTHLARVYRKIGVSDRLQAALLAREHFWSQVSASR